MDDTSLVAPQRAPIRCAIYTRQSVETHLDLTSCRVQFDLCKAHVRSRRALGYELIEEQFDDEGYSGATLDRPALNRLLDAVRRREVQRVIVHRLDRLSRNLMQSATLLGALRQFDVKLDVVTAPELGSMAFDTFLLNMLASFAEFERDMTTSRIAEARAYLKAQGRRIAGAVPFGYIADPRTKQLVVSEVEAARVEKLFAWAISGFPPSKIAADANDLGWTTKAGNPWTARQVLATLKNRTYVGLVAFGKEVRLGCHQPLIGQATFDAVQNMIAARRPGKLGRRRKPLRLDWLLRGLLRCGICGRLMSSHSVQIGPAMHLYYRCRSTAGGQTPCKGVMVPAFKIESLVLSKLPANIRITHDQAARLREAVREIVYDAASGKVKISLFKRLDELARDEAAATAQPEAEAPRTSAPRRR